HTGRSWIGWNGSVFAGTWIVFDTMLNQSGGWLVPIASDGTAVNAGAQITNFGDCFCTPHAAWSGTEWGGVFENDGFSVTSGYQTGFTRSDGAGNVIATPILVSEDGVATDNPRIVWTGTSYLVAWSRLDNGNAIGAIDVATIASDGTRLSSITLATSTSAGYI